MSWLRIDDAMIDHPKIAGLSDAAFRAHIEALCYCARHLTDGVVPLSVADRIATKAVQNEAKKARLWSQKRDKIVIKNYLEYNPSRAKVEDDRAQRSEKARLAAHARWDARSNAPSIDITDAPVPAPSLSRNRSSKPHGTAAENQRPTLTGEASRIIDQAIAAKLTSSQVLLVQTAWDASPDLRYSMADIEHAENPVAMLVAKAKQIIPPDTLSPTERTAYENSRKAASIAACRRVYNDYITAGETPERAREYIAQDYYRNPELVTAAIGQGTP